MSDPSDTKDTTMAKEFHDEISYGGDAAPTAAPVATVAAPLTVATLAARITAAVTRAQCLAVANDIANNIGVTPEGALVDRTQRPDATPIKALHAQDPVRVALRTAAIQRTAALTTARLAALLVWWRAAFAMLAQGIQQRPVSTAVVSSSVATSGLSIEQSLAAVATDATTGTASGSLADGSMRGVGFADSQGYVTALANGTKEPTTSLYLGILRSQFHYTPEQIAALTIGTIEQDTTKVNGKGINVDHRVMGADGVLRDGVDLKREAKAKAAAEVRKLADATTLALAQQVTTTDEEHPDAWWEIGWVGRGAGKITRSELIAATGSDKLAPDAKVSSTQLARALNGLRGQYDADMVNVKPAGVKVRWQVGRGKQHAAYVGAEYGKVLAIIDLHANDTITFDGDATIAAEIRARFEQLFGGDVLQPGDVTAWLSHVLRYQCGAVRNADRFLVPPQNKAKARELCGKVAAVWAKGGWVRGGLDANGEPILGETKVSLANILGGIYQGVTELIEEQEQLWATTVKAATDKAQKVGARAAATAMKRIDGAKQGEGLIAEIDRHVMLGAKIHKKLRDRAMALRIQVQTAIDTVGEDSEARFAAVELT